ncbi:hypothetical protein ACJMK2_044108, partial [Sinanodonta woodiana]
DSITDSSLRPRVDAPHQQSQPQFSQSSPWTGTLVQHPFYQTGSDMRTEHPSNSSYSSNYPPAKNYPSTPHGVNYGNQMPSNVPYGSPSKREGQFRDGVLTNSSSRQAQPGGSNNNKNMPRFITHGQSNIWTEL